MVPASRNRRRATLNQNLFEGSNHATGTTEETGPSCPEGLYADRTDDRGGDHWYLGGYRDSAVSGLRDP
ncbi:hypothetical protein D3C87_2080870 [compost metagenome]